MKAKGIASFAPIYISSSAPSLKEPPPQWGFSYDYVVKLRRPGLKKFFNQKPLKEMSEAASSSAWSSLPSQCGIKINTGPEAPTVLYPASIAFSPGLCV
jgi:hypothetical protein